MEELKEGAIRAYNGMIVCYPTGKKEPLDITEITPKFNGRYSINNSTVCFVCKDEVWVAPYTRVLLATLKHLDFSEEDFNVPFSNGNYPLEFEKKWSLLRQHSRIKMQEKMKESFINFCENFSQEKGMKKLSEDILAKCLQIPSGGMKVKYRYYEDYNYPLIDEWSDFGRIEFCLGCYCKNNGIVVFVTDVGSTYLARGYGIIKLLEDAGYREKPLYVPMSNRQEIVDEVLKRQWDSLKKFR